MSGGFDEGKERVSKPPRVPALLERPEEPFLAWLHGDPPAGSGDAPPTGDGTSKAAAQCFGGLYDHAPPSHAEHHSSPNDAVSRLEPTCDLADQERPASSHHEADGRPEVLRPRQRYGKVQKGEYQFVVRSFAPFDTFGGGFEGDERTFSTSLDVTSRITQTINVKPGPAPSAKSRAWSDPSRGHGFLPHLMHTLTGIPQLVGIGEGGGLPTDSMEATSKPRDALTMKTVGNDHLIQAKYAGAMPLTNNKLTPDIDVSTTLVISREGDLLRIFGAIRGDGFPNVEVLARDSAGQVMFLHGFQTVSGREGPMTALAGEGKGPMGSFTADLTLDEEGNFLGGRAGKKSQSVKQFNEARQELAGRAR